MFPSWAECGFSLSCLLGSQGLREEVNKWTMETSTWNGPWWEVLVLSRGPGPASSLLS